ncbi:MAG TPA: hypothetical protein VMB21_08135 [Candidatus Limnocylindria bacterium]|nr:hypothetical protein [Candidatus Limnocylindria bacterium]
MKTLKVSLALLSVGIGTLFAVSAAEALNSPRAAANAAPVATTPAPATPHAMGMGCMGMAGTMAPAQGAKASADASAHCQAPQKGHAHMACCN